MKTQKKKKKDYLSYFKQDVFIIGSNEVDSRSENRDPLLLGSGQSSEYRYRGACVIICNQLQNKFGGPAGFVGNGKNLNSG